MQNTAPLLTLLAASVAPLGCDTVMSSEVPTEQVRLFTEARIASDGRVSVVTQLTTDNPALLEQTYLDLDWDDALYAHLEGETVPMRRDWVPVLNLVQYRAEFTDGQAGDELSIELDRSLEVSARDSYVSIPEPFSIDAPDVFSRQQPLAIAWSAASAQNAHLHLRGPCLREVAYFFEDNPGEVTIPADSLEKEENSIEDSCGATLSVEVSNDGVVDPAFGRGGSISAIQERSEALQSLP